jgi:hypothetical protein
MDEIVTLGSFNLGSVHSTAMIIALFIAVRLAVQYSTCTHPLLPTSNIVAIMQMPFTTSSHTVVSVLLLALAVHVQTGEWMYLHCAV